MPRDAEAPTYKRTSYLVDRSIQLKYSGILVALTLVVAAPLGFLLLRDIQDAIRMGNEASDAGKTAIGQVTILNRRLETEAMLRYKDDPAALEAAKRANEIARRDAEDIARRIETQRTALQQKSVTLAWAVGGGLTLLVILVGIGGIFLTHKVAGPVYRMRQMFRDLGEGKFSPYRPLRKGDELQEFFSEFSELIEKLRDRQKTEIVRLDAAIEKAAAAGVSDGSLSDLRVARDALAKSVTGAA
jgi:nitrogen fixation/metabolism regulation signal transduction histidine kinase